jgi:hypothetical protein
MKRTLGTLNFHWPVSPPHLSSGESVREKDVWTVIKERPTPEVLTQEEAVEVPKQLGPLSQLLLPVATIPALPRSQ